MGEALRGEALKGSRGEAFGRSVDGGIQVNRTHNRNLVGLSQTLRKNMTKQERHLWYDFLKQLPMTIHRQKVFGKYIADFYIAEAKLVIELDGSQHFEDEEQEKDTQRDAYLNSLGLRVVRIPNNAVTENFGGVCEHILHLLKEPSP